MTPSRELLENTQDLPVFVLIRERPGNFVFTEAEIRSMCEDIEIACEAGVAGIVCGALLANGEIDQGATRRFLEAAQGVPFTFHKGFDACGDLERGMEVLVNLGVDRVLTSGGERLAVDAIDRLAALARIGGEATRVLCGGGVRSDNLPGLVEIPGVSEFHSAARADVTEPVSTREVRAMREVLDRE